MRLADYVASTLEARGLTHVFMVTGGGAMHLNDAFGRSQMKIINCHHEQACAMAAESYYRISNKLAAVNVTTGPGAINALNGVFGAFTDSIGMIVISGQVRTSTIGTPPLRQLGDQEAPTLQMVTPITKYAALVDSPNLIRYHLERALWEAASGRPGPVWLDIPIDIQGATVDPSTLVGFDPPILPGYPDRAKLVLDRLKLAKRPVLLAGAGVRLSGDHDAFIDLVEKLQIPVVTGWNAHDAIWDHPLYVGRPGSVGDRAGNFAVQSADFLLILGSRLNVRQISYNYENFAPHAYKVMVDIDPYELTKPTLKIDLPIQANLADFLHEMNYEYYQPVAAHLDYLKWCWERKEKYPVVLPEYYESPAVNPYVFTKSLFKHLVENDAVICGDGTACVTTFQAADLKRGQRLYTNSGSASMGYDLPAAIGATLATNLKRLVCITGDGSIMMNLQELQTITHHKLPIKIFILNNQGYHSIRQTQQNYFPGNEVGCGPESGLSFPDFKKIADAFGIHYYKIATHHDLRLIPSILEEAGPQICEVMIDLNQQFAPKLTSRMENGVILTPALDDMAPFLSREELESNRWHEKNEES